LSKRGNVQQIYGVQVPFELYKTNLCSGTRTALVSEQPPAIVLKLWKDITSNGRKGPNLPGEEALEKRGGGRHRKWKKTIPRSEETGIVGEWEAKGIRKGEGDPQGRGQSESIRGQPIREGKNKTTQINISIRENIVCGRKKGQFWKEASQLSGIQ